MACQSQLIFTGTERLVCGQKLAWLPQFNMHSFSLSLSSRLHNIRQALQPCKHSCNAFHCSLPAPFMQKQPHNSQNDANIMQSCLCELPARPLGLDQPIRSKVLADNVHSPPSDLEPKGIRITADVHYAALPGAPTRGAVA